MFPGVNEQDFKKILRENLTPAKAISSPEHLRGRDKNLRNIARTFNSPGKNIFIDGDRGVGKTSLAQTAAYLHQSSSTPPLIVTCDEDSSFSSVIKDIANFTLNYSQKNK